MPATPRALGVVALTTSLGVALFVACGGPARSADPPMAGSAAILPSPVSAEIVPKSAKSAESSASPHATGTANEQGPGQKNPAEVVAPPVVSASASGTTAKDKASDKQCKGKNGQYAPGPKSKGASCAADHECASCICTAGICSRPIITDD